MKRVKNIFDKITELSNIEAAIYHAAKGKKDRRAVERILDSPYFYAKEIQKMLIEETYNPSPYVIVKIHDGVRKKERIIYKPRFYPDQIIHWAIMLVVEPILFSSMYEHSYSSMKGKGVHKAAKYIKKVLTEDVKNSKYCLVLDVSKFYPNINQFIVFKKIVKKIKDVKALKLIAQMIRSTDSGVPIGTRYSPTLANFMLTDLDHYIKEKLKVKYYARYMDDMILFSNNKKKLHQIRKDIEDFLKKEDLSLKSNWKLFKVSSRPIDFVGFRFKRETKPKIKVILVLRKSNFLRMRRRLTRIMKKHKKMGYYTYRDACAVVSYIGMLKLTDKYTFCKKYIEPYFDMEEIKGVIRFESYKRLQTRK